MGSKVTFKSKDGKLDEITITFAGYDFPDNATIKGLIAGSLQATGASLCYIGAFKRERVPASMEIEENSEQVLDEINKVENEKSH
jgi:hypothetical protein